MSADFRKLSDAIWDVADLLRGPYRPPQYERVMLPLAVLRRFDAVLAFSKALVLERYAQLRRKDSTTIDAVCNNTAVDESGQMLGFHNHSPLDFQKLRDDPAHIAAHLTDYIAGFSENIRQIFERFEFEKEIEALDKADRLYAVVSRFAEIDLHPDRVDNITMGLVFEDLIRRFNEQSNETAGDHFTPREVIQLMVNLLLEPDTDVLTQAGIIVTLCDPACGTGGMLTEAQNWIRAHNARASVKVYGQDYNPHSYAVAASDLLIKGQRDSRIACGNTLLNDCFEDMPHFDYLLANPPFGVDWKAEKKQIDRWSDFRGYRGKLPRINDGALLFLLHMLGKFVPYAPGDKARPGSRAAIVFNGSPLFSGGAGSGESEIRRHIIERDYLEAIIALPEQMFYNTGIGTFIWVVTNRKTPERTGKIQFIDARARWAPMKRSLGDKRRLLDAEAIREITREHGTLAESKTSRLFDNADFGYRRITIQRPLRLRFQITDEACARFLAQHAELALAIEHLKTALGPAPRLDWAEAWGEVQRVFRKLPAGATGWAAGARGTAQKKAFRDCFTTRDPAAAPLVAKQYRSIPPELSALAANPPEGLSREDSLALYGLHADGAGGFIDYEPDPELRDFETVPLKEDPLRYTLREVRPWLPDAWIDREARDEADGQIGKVGYEINFNRVFFEFTPPRPLAEIDSELAQVEAQIVQLLKEVGV